MNRRLKATVQGRVQGVGFRAFVVENAQRLGLNGSVRNVYFPRRTVEVVAEGPEDALQQLLLILHEGPSLARVDDVEAHFSTYTGEYASFRFA
ncbi:MAG: acylphosphatase [Caldilineales bacterium]|nr:acylphosphatase [Caldilineales bacterium]